MVAAREVKRDGGDSTATLTLPYEARSLRRRRLTTDQGEVFLLDLAEVTELHDGDVILLGDGRGVTIRAAAEALAEITGCELTRLAWHIGNRHAPCQIEPARLLIARDHVLEDMVRRLGGTVRHVEEPFRPEGGAYGHGRTHGHSHIPHRYDHAHG